MLMMAKLHLQHGRKRFANSNEPLKTLASMHNVYIVKEFIYPSQ